MLLLKPPILMSSFVSTVDNKRQLTAVCIHMLHADKMAAD